jgi:hypothetical protein
MGFVDLDVTGLWLLNRKTVVLAQELFQYKTELALGKRGASLVFRHVHLVLKRD